MFHKYVDDVYTGLVLEVVALRNITVGEEVTVDYGQEWEKAWYDHVKSWKLKSGVESESNVNIHVNGDGDGGGQSSTSTSAGANMGRETMGISPQSFIDEKMTYNGSGDGSNDTEKEFTPFCTLKELEKHPYPKCVRTA